MRIEASLSLVSDLGLSLTSSDCVIGTRICESFSTQGIMNHIGNAGNFCGCGLGLDYKLEKAVSGLDTPDGARVLLHRGRRGTEGGWQSDRDGGRRTPIGERAVGRRKVTGGGAAAPPSLPRERGRARCCPRRERGAPTRKDGG